MSESTFLTFAVILVGAVFASFYRAVVGPTPADRLVAISVIGTKAVLVITLVSFAFDQKFFLDISLVYTLISFLGTVGLAKYLEKGSLGR